MQETESRFGAVRSRPLPVRGRLAVVVSVGLLVTDRGERRPV